jgi:hypothetical protein
MSNSFRDDYLNKIRAVEKIKQDGGTDIEPDAASEGTSDVSSLYAGDTPDLSSAAYQIPAIKKYPEKIQLPNMTRGQYNKIITGYAQANIMNDDMFGVPDPTKFSLYYWGADGPRFKGEGRLRKDFLFYLEELHAIVTPKIGVKKLTLNSTFRTIAWQHKVDGNSKVNAGPHMGGIAADIAVHGDDRYYLADQAYYMGFGGIAIGAAYVHIDIGCRGYYWNYPPIPTYYSPDRKYG